jgi:hypothetical protein
MFKKVNVDGSRSLQRSIKKAGMTKNNVIPTGGFNSMSRMANAQVVRMTPKPFSPFYEESNLMLPRDRREVNAWARHYYATDPWVGNAIDLHSTYPLSAFGVKSDDPLVTKFFNQMLDKLNFSSIIYDIGKEYNIIGEVFPYSELDDNTGEWSKIIIQNPDYIEVKSNVLTTSMISLMPDDELKRLVTSTNPDDIALRAQIDPEVLAYVYAGKNIPLSNRYVSHLARKNSPYDVRGTSILTRVFKDLMLRDKYREAQFAIADNHITPLKIFKVGTADGTYRPTSDDLVAFRQMIEEATYDPNFTLVTHPGLEVQYVGSTGVILPLDGEMDRIEDRVLTGLFTSKAFTHSEGPTYANASVALEVLQQRYVAFRTLIEKWLELKIFRPICKIQGFEKIVGGKSELILPKVNWDKINLKNNREYQQALEGMVKENKVSLHTYFRALDVSFDEEMELINKEIDPIKEINHRLDLPYTGREGINVSEDVKQDVPEADAGEEEGDLPEGGGGGDFGGGGDMGDLGDLGDLGDEGDAGGLDSVPGGDEGGEV